MSTPLDPLVHEAAKEVAATSRNFILFMGLLNYGAVFSALTQGSSVSWKVWYIVASPLNLNG